MTTDAVLLMAYGSPDSLEQVEAYYTDIRRGSPPAPHLLEELLGRYRAIGGGSPSAGSSRSSGQPSRPNWPPGA